MVATLGTIQGGEGVPLEDGCLQYKKIACTHEQANIPQQNKEPNVCILERAIKKFRGIEATSSENRAYKIFDQIIFDQIDLLVHFLSSVSTNRVALKPQNPLIAPSNAYTQI